MRITALALSLALLAIAAGSPAGGGRGGVIALSLIQGVGWDSSAWSYYREITVDNQGNEALASYPVEVKLTSGNFDFANAESDGADIRVSESDGTTLLDHWLEHWDSVGEVGYIMVEVPAIDADSNHTLRVYYGNASASTTSSWASVFTGNAVTAVSAPTLVNVHTASNYDSFPSAILMDNGDVGVTLRTATTHESNDGDIIFRTSSDGGSTWAAAVTVINGADPYHQNLGLVQLADGTLFTPMVNQVNPGPTTHDAYFVTSDDDGATWSSRTLIANTFGKPRITPYGQVIELADGTLLMPTQNIAGGTGDDSILIQSTDSGVTWTLRGTIADDGSNGYTETAVYQVNATDFIAIVRELDNGLDDDAYYVTSADAGVTWGTPAAMWHNEGGGSPDIIALDDGRLLLCIGDRSSSEGIRCHTSSDDGEHWSGGTMVFEADAGQGFDGGYPSSAQLAGGGNLLTTYYYNVSGSLTDVQVAIYDPDYLGNPDVEANLVDAEAGNVSDWTITGDTAVASTNQAHNGTYSVRFSDDDAAVLNFAVNPIWDTAQWSGAIVLWVYADTIVNGLNIGLAEVDSATFGDQEFMLTWRSTGEVIWYNGSNQSFSPTLSPSTDAWHKFVINFDSTLDRAELYVDGESKGRFGAWDTDATTGYLHLYANSTAGTGDIFYVDDAYTYAYTYNVPTTSVGAEEAQ